MAMRPETIRKLLAARREAREDYPFGPEVMVFKVRDKMFACVALDEKPLRLIVKCDPDDVEMLREIHPGITPPPYFDKRHWNSVALDGSIPRKEIERMVDESWRLVVAKLKKSDRAELGAG